MPRCDGKGQVARHRYRAETLRTGIVRASPCGRAMARITEARSFACHPGRGRFSFARGGNLEGDGDRERAGAIPHRSCPATALRNLARSSWPSPAMIVPRRAKLFLPARDQSAPRNPCKMCSPRSDAIPSVARSPASTNADTRVLPVVREMEGIGPRRQWRGGRTNRLVPQRVEEHAIDARMLRPPAPHPTRRRSRPPGRKHAREFGEGEVRLRKMHRCRSCTARHRTCRPAKARLCASATWKTGAALLRCRDRDHVGRKIDARRRWRRAGRPFRPANRGRSRRPARGPRHPPRCRRKEQGMGSLPSPA